MMARKSGLPRIYCDTSFLMSHLIDDENTDEARAVIYRLSARSQISELTRLEYHTAICQKVGRNEFSKAESKKALSELERQLDMKWFVLRVDVEMSEVWKRAHLLTDKYTAQFKLRSLDIWHVAFAMTCGTEIFLTFDKRQSELARSVGMVVNPQ